MKPDVKPLLAVSMGDPAGVGPEVVLKAATVYDVRSEADVVVFGDPIVLERAVRDTATPMRIVEIERVEDG